MKISYNWLKQYLDTDLTPREAGEILTNIGLEVEGIETFHSVRGGLEGVVVGEVLTCEKHPNADKLSVATVDIGDGNPLSIVCGAPNVEAGQKVPVAQVGSTIYPGGKEGVVIRKAKIRGETSQGMICAEDELGLGTSHDGIMVLDPEVRTGTAAAEYFGVETDAVFEIDLTPNRIDAASHLGVARDLAAWMNQQGTVRVSRPPVDAFSVDNEDLPVQIEIDEKAGCTRYSGLTISGVRVEESPDWLQSRLRAIGLAPVNNVVDITNYVLHECGQPLHAFDADKVTGHRVVVRTMPEGSRFTTLDGVERTLLGSDLVISNSEEAMCIAGVFGGISSGVTEGTTRVFLESACFDPVYIRKTARHHNLKTDASFRFERGSDPNLTVWALKRAAILIREIAGGKITSRIVDVYPEPVEDFRVEVTFDSVNRLIGNPIDPDTMQSILESLDITVEFRNDVGMLLKVPPYRVDVRREADIVEEMLRIYGFNRIEAGEELRSTLPYSSTSPNREKEILAVSSMLSARGFFEMKSNSLTPTAYYDTDEREDPGVVRLQNPLSQDLAAMRKTLLFGGLEAIAYNINRKNADLKLYEFGTCYSRRPSSPVKDLLDPFVEELRLALFMSGRAWKGNWARSPEKATFFLLKTELTSVLEKLGIDSHALSQEPAKNAYFQEGISWSAGGNVVAEAGKVSAELLGRFQIDQDVFAAEFRWEAVTPLLSGKQIRFRPLPRFQKVTRDLSMVLDRDITYHSLRELAFRTERKLLKDVDLFDVYEGDRIEQGKKSYALTFTLLDEEKTLTDKQIDKTMRSLAGAYEKEFGAVIRGKEHGWQR